MINLRQIPLTLTVVILTTTFANAQTYVNKEWVKNHKAMRTISLYIIAAILISSCQENAPVEPPISNCSYSTYSTDSYEKLFKKLFTPMPIGPFYFYPERYHYSDPVFNPRNEYEIAYLRYDNWNTIGCDKELWKFNFCTGEAKILTDHVCYSPDWSSKGWIIFTAQDRQLWKIKDNGDSLIQLSNEAGYNNDAKWNPDGTLYAYSNQGGKLAQANGKIIKEIEVNPLSWIDTVTIIGTNMDGIVSYDILSEATSVLHTAKPAGTFPFNVKQMELYYADNAKGNQSWIKFRLGDGQTDTLRKLYHSYFYGEGSYAIQTNKAVMQLVRKKWKDSTQNEIYYRSNLIIMNPDGTEERLIQLP